MLDLYDHQVIDYFQQIAMGFESGSATEVTRRWEQPMKVYLGGSPTEAHREELGKIIGEINDLITAGFFVEEVSDSMQSNYYIYFGSGADYARIFPIQSHLVESNYGLFRIYWNGQQQLIRGHMYVDVFRATPVEQLHLLREELTQSLGLPRDSYQYPGSIFQQSYSTKTTEFMPIDRDLIRLLYHPMMQTNLNEVQVEDELEKILLSEK